MTPGILISLGNLTYCVCVFHIKLVLNQDKLSCPHEVVVFDHISTAVPTFRYETMQKSAAIGGTLDHDKRQSILRLLSPYDEGVQVSVSSCSCQLLQLSFCPVPRPPRKRRPSSGSLCGPLVMYTVAGKSMGESAVPRMNWPPSSTET